jgi:hypothetical protein
LIVAKKNKDKRTTVFSHKNPPQSANPPNPNKPEVEYEIDYVYGYKSDETCVNNLFLN